MAPSAATVLAMADGVGPFIPWLTDVNDWLRGGHPALQRGVALRLQAVMVLELVLVLAL